jgi:hypothetical protein
VDFSGGTLWHLEREGFAASRLLLVDEGRCACGAGAGTGVLGDPRLPPLGVRSVERCDAPCWRGGFVSTRSCRSATTRDARGTAGLHSMAGAGRLSNDTVTREVGGLVIVGRKSGHSYSNT